MRPLHPRLIALRRLLAPDDSALFSMLLSAPKLLPTQLAISSLCAIIAYDDDTANFVTVWLACTYLVVFTRDRLQSKFNHSTTAQREEWREHWLLFGAVAVTAWAICIFALLVGTMSRIPFAGQMAILLIVAQTISFAAVYSAPAFSAMQWLLLPTVTGVSFFWLQEHNVAIGVACIVAMLLYEDSRRRQTALLKRQADLISEQQLMTEDLTNLNRFKTNLLATASHDLRQPVHALGLLLATWDADLEPSQHGHRIANVRMRTNLMSQMLQSLLDVSKIEFGIYTPSPQRFELHGLVQEVASSFAEQAAQKGLALATRNALYGETWIETDRGLLGRVISNLLDNAIKVTEVGSIELSLYSDSEGVHLAVQDSGPGVELALRKRIFEDYFTKPVSPGPHNGLGIGLSVVRRGTELLGMTARVETGVPIGAKFLIDIPADHPALGRQDSGPEPVRVDGQSRLPLTVLYVDDDELALEAVAALMDRWGCVVRTASTGDEGVRIVRDEAFTPDVVITDYQLGRHIDGFDCMEQIRTLQGCDEAAYVLLTGDLSVELRQRALDAGVELFHKPMSPARLRAVLDSIAASKQVPGLHKLSLSAVS